MLVYQRVADNTDENRLSPVICPKFVPLVLEILML